MLVIDHDDLNTTENDEYFDAMTQAGKAALKEFTKTTYSVLVDMRPPDKLKQLFRESFGYAIKTQQYSIVSDLIMYSKDRFFPLFVTSEIMDTLLIKRQFMLMQTLVRRAMIFKQKVEAKDQVIQEGVKTVEVF
jgi:hypothetical protein